MLDGNRDQIQFRANCDWKYFAQLIFAHQLWDRCYNLILRFVIIWLKWSAKKRGILIGSPNIFQILHSDYTNTRHSMSKFIKDASVSHQMYNVS